MNGYHKIQTVFKRDPETNYRTLTTEFARPEFEYLAECQWEWTEKVDGTNIRVKWEPSGSPGITFGGKTERAQIPARLIEVLESRFLFNIPKFLEIFDSSVCLYGEGHGAKIQKGGGNYISDGVDFVLFDVKIGDWWLQREDIEEIAEKLNIQTVPVVGHGTLSEAVDKVRCGFSSRWGNFLAEGLVLRPRIELKSRAGERIITKIKHKDFAINKKGN